VLLYEFDPHNASNLLEAWRTNSSLQRTPEEERRYLHLLEAAAKTGWRQHVGGAGEEEDYTEGEAAVGGVVGPGVGGRTMFEHGGAAWDESHIAF
jgi:hypothetical protein